MKQSKELNIGLIRQLKKSLISYLDKSEEFLNLSKESSDFNDLKINLEETIKNIHTVSNNIKIINLVGEYEFVYHLENALLKLKNEENIDLNELRNKLDLLSIGLSKFKKYLDDKITLLSNTGKKDFYIIELWNEWKTIQIILGDNPKVSDLFFPNLNISRLNEKDYYLVDFSELKDKTKEAISIYENNAKKWLNASNEFNSKENIKNALEENIRIIDKLKSLKIKGKEEFYGYFLALKLRLQQAIENNLEFEKPLNLKNVLENSIVEINYFVTDTAQLNYAVLKHILFNFVLKENLKNIEISEEGQELIKLYNLDVFFNKAIETIDVEEKERMEDFEENLNTLEIVLNKNIEILEQIQGENPNLSSTMKEVVFSDRIKNNFKISINNLVKFKDLFNPNLSEKIFSPVELIQQELANDTFILNGVKFFELANFFFILKEYSLVKENVLLDFIREFELQIVRLNKVLVFDDIHNDNEVDYGIIGKVKIKEQYRNVYKSTSLALKSVKQDLETFYKNKNVSSLNKTMIDLSQIMAVLVSLNKNEASLLVQKIREVTNEYIMEGFDRVEEAEKEKQMEALQITEVYLEQLEQGDEDAEEFIKPYLEKILNLPAEKDFEVEYRKVDFEYQPKEEIVAEIENINKSSFSISALGNNEDLMEVGAVDNSINESLENKEEDLKAKDSVAEEDVENEAVQFYEESSMIIDGEEEQKIKDDLSSEKHIEEFIKPKEVENNLNNVLNENEVFNFGNERVEVEQSSQKIIENQDEQNIEENENYLSNNEIEIEQEKIEVQKTFAQSQGEVLTEFYDNLLGYNQKSLSLDEESLSYIKESILKENNKIIHYVNDLFIPNKDNFKFYFEKLSDLIKDKQEKHNFEENQYVIDKVKIISKELLEKLDEVVYFSNIGETVEVDFSLIENYFVDLENENSTPENIEQENQLIEVVKKTENVLSNLTADNVEKIKNSLSIVIEELIKIRELL